MVNTVNYKVPSYFSNGTFLQITRYKYKPMWAWTTGSGKPFQTWIFENGSQVNQKAEKAGNNSKQEVISASTNHQKSTNPSTNHNGVSLNGQSEHSDPVPFSTEDSKSEPMSNACSDGSCILPGGKRATEMPTLKPKTAKWKPPTKEQLQ